MVEQIPIFDKVSRPVNKLHVGVDSYIFWYVYMKGKPPVNSLSLESRNNLELCRGWTSAMVATACKLLYLNYT